jgi:hypothetical protein
MIAFGILVSKNMPDTDGNQYVTRADLRAELRTVEDRMINTIANTIAKAIAQSQAEILEKTQEFVRDSQTELLRGFDAFSTAFHVRVRKLQADVSNIDAATDQRLTLIERRMFEIEKRWQIPPPEL